MAEDTKSPQNRKPGTFEKGDPRINPGGRTRIPDDVKEMWRAATPKATQMLVEAIEATRAVVIPGGRDAPGAIEYVPDWDVRLKAIEVLYSRQWGKPAQSLTGEDGGAIQLGVVILPPEEAD